MAMKNNNLVSFIIPCYNEREGIRKTISNLADFLKKNKIKYDIIIVDDGSKDGTLDIIKNMQKYDKKIRLLLRKQNPGFGYSLIDGSEIAKGNIVIWVMGDSSDDLNTILKMIEKINLGFDMVIGSRNVSGGSRGDQDKLKAFGSRLYSRLAKFLFGLPVYDITNAFRAFRKELIFKIQLENGNFAISPEFSIKAHKKGFKIGEVPTNYNERKIGEAKTKLFRMGLFYYMLLVKYFFTLR